VTLERDLVDMMKRYRNEVRDLERSLPRLPTHAEKVPVQTHAHVKSACANELSRILQRNGVKVAP